MPGWPPGRHLLTHIQEELECGSLFGARGPSYKSEVSGLLMGLLEQNRATRAYVSTVILGGMAAIAQSVYQLVTQPADPRWLLLATLTLVSGWANLRLTAVSATISVSETFVFTCVILFGASAGTLTVAVEAVVLSLSLYRKRRTEPYRILFNIAAPSLSIWVAANLFFWLAATPPLLTYDGNVRIMDVALPLVAFTLVYFLLNSWLIAFAISLAERVSALGVWKNNLLWLLLNYLGGASVAALLVGYRGTFGVALLLVIAPILLVLHFTMRTVLGRVEDANQHLARMNTLYLSTIETLATAIDAKDQVTHGHIRRVQYFATALAREIGISEDAQLKAIEAAALLHDMGKLAVPDHILNKPGPLTATEFAKMQRHAAIGAEILSAIEFPYPVVPIVRHHHEHWDGGGYPDGLKGTEIPIGARILSVVDCFDALTSDRPYRRKLEDRIALGILSERRGNMYDPLVVDTFLNNYEKFSLAAEKLEGASSLPGFEAIAESGAERAKESLSATPVGQSSPLMSDAIASLAANAIGASSDCTIVVFRRRDNGEELVAETAIGMAEALFKGTTTSMTERVVGWVAANGTSLHNADARLDGPAMQRMGTCTAIPIRDSGSVSGVLAVYTYRDRVLTEKETARLELLVSDKTGRKESV